MRMSQWFSRTLREAPSHAVLPHHQLLTRAGYVQEIGKGSFALLPLGVRALEGIGQTFLRHLNLPSARVELPLLQAHEGRLNMDEDGWRFEDAQGRQTLLPGSLDDTFECLARQHISSYRQLPAFLHYCGPLWQNEIHAGCGLFYSRTPGVLELFGAYPDVDSLQQGIEQVAAALEKTLQDCWLSPMVSPKEAAGTCSTEPCEWFLPHLFGKEVLFSCRHCGYTASSAAARYRRLPAWQESVRPLQKVFTPECKTIEALSQYLDIPKERTAKAIFLMASYEGNAQPTLVFTVIPGDRELDERRLLRVLNAVRLHPASNEEIEAGGSVPGYGSPVGIADACVVVDAQIPLSANLVAGANEHGYHFINVNFPRDFTARYIAEISVPRSGDACPDCGEPLVRSPAVKLASLQSACADHSYMDADGKFAPLHTLTCRLYTTRLLAVVADLMHDEHGLILPRAAAPYSLHLVLLQDKEGAVEKQANELVRTIETAGFDLIYDDRNERAGVKFNDADLIGLPLRLTISKRSLEQESLEWKQRTDDTVQLIRISDLLQVLNEYLIA